jgi:hypothetical protein
MRDEPKQTDADKKNKTKLHLIVIFNAPVDKRHFLATVYRRWVVVPERRKYSMSRACVLCPASASPEPGSAGGGG